MYIQCEASWNMKVLSVSGGLCPQTPHCHHRLLCQNASPLRKSWLQSQTGPWYQCQSNYATDTSLQCLGRQHQINFTQLSSSSRNTQYEIYFHIKDKGLIWRFSWYKMKILFLYLNPLAIHMFAHSDNWGTTVSLMPSYLVVDVSIA